MKRRLVFLALVLVLSLGLVASKSYASGNTGGSGFKMSHRSNLIGAAVEDSCGNLVGIINGVMVDSGGTTLAIVNHGDYDLTGEGGINTIVPLQELRISRTKDGQQVALLKMDMEHFDFAPYYDPLQTNSREDEASIYAYYGIHPYWTESGELSE
jgi:hypothetical protein